ncbi:MULTISPECIES: iron-containing alcohol dehydrogenase [Clostridium]|uniref:NADH-dependent butanol dehydrogenase A n=1 Tax=Clostridium ragsdalei P11 TaxID=1353534 RepID=A0A1A6AVJ5_9CLOT|nr:MULTISPECIES: iron-containing alcohol dehydrogenase [Clostridium]OBR94072.1 NADH-dependent butanol dehydrogenase A [Clostridium ragsdalei P11]QXE17670.1 NADH-dependent alcohol dehydrogenase [Clostridium sp. 001]
MENFIFKNATEIIFGKDTEDLVGSKVKEYSKSDKILFCYGGGSIKRSGLYDRVIKSLKENGIEFIELPGIKPNPRLGPVKEGIRLCRENNIKFVLSVGGGSSADTAKAIAVGVPYKGDVWDFYTGKAEVKEALPVGVVITLPATGTESSNSSVIMNEDGWFKKGLNTVLIRPAFSIMNPELTFTLPEYQTACGACDIMAHIMERYFTNVKHVDLTDRLCEAALRNVINNAPIVLKDPKNYDARAEIMWTGTIAHNDVLSTGRIGDWASHKIEHELSGETDIAHGAGLAIVFPAWMKYVYKHDINRFVQFAVRVWDVDLSYSSCEDIVLEGIRRMTAFFKSMGLPITLKEGSIGEDKIEEMANKCTDNGTKTVGQFVKLNKDDIVKILNLAR